MSQDAHNEKNGKPPTPNRPSTANPLQVLLAEDDTELRKLLAWSLRQEGYAVTECADGISLLNHLDTSLTGEQSQTFDLIISDIRMPGITGLEILEGINGLQGFAPVILITAFGDEETHARAQRAGAAAIFDKPFDIDDLLAKVHEIETLSPSVANHHLFFREKETRPPAFPVDIVFRHLAPAKQIEAFVRKKAARLNHFGSSISNCRVVIDVPHRHHKHGNLYQVHVTLSVLDHELVVDHDRKSGAARKDLYAVISNAFEVACHQVEVFIDKHKVHKERAGNG